eukprot:gene27564-8813_t
MANRFEKAKLLQYRFELAQTESQNAKERQQAAKEKLDEAIFTMTNDCGEILQLSSELSMLETENGNVQHQLKLVQMELDIFQTNFSVNCGASLPAQRKYFNTHLAWPRVVLTSRGSKILHSKLCSSMEAISCVTTEYYNHRELEAVMSQNGMMLCHVCREDCRF